MEPGSGTGIWKLWSNSDRVAVVPVLLDRLMSLEMNTWFTEAPFGNVPVMLIPELLSLWIVASPEPWGQVVEPGGVKGDEQATSLIVATVPAPPDDPTVRSIALIPPVTVKKNRKSALPPWEACIFGLKASWTFPFDRTALVSPIVAPEPVLANPEKVRPPKVQLKLPIRTLALLVHVPANDWVARNSRVNNNAARFTIEPPSVFLGGHQVIHSYRFFDILV